MANLTLARLLAGLATYLRPSTLAYADTSPPAGDPPAGDPPGDPPGDPAPDELVAEFGEKGAAEIRKLRGENAKHRTKNGELTTKLTEIERSQLTETEQAKARANEAETKAQAAETRARNTAIVADLKVHAATLGAVDVDAVVQLVDREKVEADDDGNVKGGKAAVEALLKAKPYLAGTPGAPPRNGSNFGGPNGEKPPGGSDMNAAIRRAAGIVAD